MAEEDTVEAVVTAEAVVMGRAQEVDMVVATVPEVEDTVAEEDMAVVE